MERSDLRPPELEAVGLLPAPRRHLDRYRRQTGIWVDLRTDDVDRRFPAPVEVAAYRVAEEALTNVARHAGIDRVTVRLAADLAVLTVSVWDAGRGYDPESTAPEAGCAGCADGLSCWAGCWWSMPRWPGESR
jgi:signal transduction histidine kinase